MKINKKYNNSYHLLGFCILLLVLSCEDLIEIDYPNNQINSEQVFEDIQTANSALAGLYAGVRDQSLIAGNNFGAGSLLGSYTDDLDCFTNSPNGTLSIYNNQQQPTNSEVTQAWNNAYQLIYASNAIITGVTNSESLDQTQRDYLKGEALFIRSLLYFYLQQLFGDIPYTTSLDFEQNRTLPRTNGLDVLNLLETDLLLSIDLLQSEYRSSQRIYANQKTAQLLLAKIYLTKGEYLQAEQLASEIINSNFYQFENDIEKVFHNTGTHILWQLPPQQAGNATWEANFYYFINAAPRNYALSNSLMSAFSPEDLRKSTWTKQVNFEDQTWYRASKYKKRAGENNIENSVVFRLEEVYFVLAEALAMQNRLSEAIPYLNATRIRANLPPLANLSQEDFISELLLEKRKEFFTEFGHRFLDLKRFGKLQELSLVKPNWSDHHKVWPVPQNELLLNPNLLPQNDGY